MGILRWYIYIDDDERQETDDRSVCEIEPFLQFLFVAIVCIARHFMKERKTFKVFSETKYVDASHLQKREVESFTWKTRWDRGTYRYWYRPAAEFLRKGIYSKYYITLPWNALVLDLRSLGMILKVVEESPLDHWETEKYAKEVFC